MAQAMTSSMAQVLPSLHKSEASLTVLMCHASATGPDNKPTPITPLICHVRGTDPESKALRTALWEVSKTRSYPQVFLKNEFVGDMDGIQELLDSGKFATVFEGFANACTPR